MKIQNWYKSIKFCHKKKKKEKRKKKKESSLLNQKIKIGEGDWKGCKWKITRNIKQKRNRKQGKKILSVSQNVTRSWTMNMRKEKRNKKEQCPINKDWNAKLYWVLLPPRVTSTEVTRYSSSISSTKQHIMC